MTTHYRERPFLRRKIKKFLEQNPHISLGDMARRYYIDRIGHRHNLYITEGMRTQARKMLAETPQDTKTSVTKSGFDQLLREREPNKPLYFDFTQTGKIPTIGSLTAILDGIVILIDSFNIAIYKRRCAFLDALRDTNQVPSCKYPSKDLSKCLLDITVRAMAWPGPGQCHISWEFQRGDS